MTRCSLAAMRSASIYRREGVASMFASVRPPVVRPKPTKRFCLILLLWITTIGGNAQEFRALLSGVVRDPSGSAIPAASVTIRNVDTNLAVTVQSATDGAYFIPQLPVGKYQLTVEAKGFKKYTREGITLGLGDK